MIDRLHYLDLCYIYAEYNVLHSTNFKPCIFSFKNLPKKEICLVKENQSELITLLNQVYSSAPLLVFSHTIFSQGQ